MSIRYINSNDLINDVPDYLQNIINNMDCVYVDGIKPNNQHFNLEEHDKQIRADAIMECIEIIVNIMPGEPFIKNSKHYENWKMKTTELRMLRDMLLEQLKETKK